MTRLPDCGTQKVETYSNSCKAILIKFSHAPSTTKGILLLLGPRITPVEFGGIKIPTKCDVFPSYLLLKNHDIC